MYLRPHDYTTAIRSGEFDRLKPSDKDLEEAYRTELDDVKACLAYRFDVDKIFYDVLVWDPNATYQDGDVVSLEAPMYEAGKQYQSGDLARYGDLVYKATATVSSQNPDSSSSWTPVGEADRIYISQKDSNSNTPDSTDWEKRDPRPANIRTKLVDLILYRLYCFTQPRNIPDFRKDLAEKAEKWFKEVQKGVHQMDLPKAHPGTTKDDVIRFGGNRRHTL